MNIADQIRSLKKKRNAVILVHNYQLPEIQDIADFIGDSLGLSIKASKTQADVIVFCGVYFMAETAKIVSPQKTVLIPDKLAGCPMADMISAESLRELKNKHPQAKVLCYVNTSAEVKAEADMCCTSANAVTMLQEGFQPQDEIIFVPDKYLANYAASQTGRKLITWNGYCPSHVKILPQDIQKQKQLHPQAKVLVHPECTPDVIRLADVVCSTEGIFHYVQKSQDEEFIIGTETDMLYRLRVNNPGKKFYPASELAICPNMKRITLDKVHSALERIQFEVTVEPSILVKAQKSIKRMMECKAAVA
ncbi:MAG: quinolinate synthase NadA [Candidatus Omnitrophota bacterium]